jgi:titin
MRTSRKALIPRSLRRSFVALVVGALAAAAFAQVAAADPPTVPDAPSITDVTLGHNAVTIAITPNADGGDAIVGYTVTCDSSDGGTTQSATDDSPVTVTGLDNGKTYSCTAVATNGVGDSDPSDPTDDFVAATIPNAPSIDSVTPLTNNQVRVAFTPGTDGGDEVIFFKATCASSNGGTTKTKTGASSPLTVTSLSNNRTYTCTMTATNSIGVSSASAASSSFVAGTAPATPTVSVARGNDSAIVTVTGGNGGSAITGYAASCTSSDGGDPQSASNGTSPVTVSGLTHGKTYTCTATATNTFGTSASSVASSSFVAAILPDAPTLTGVTRGSNSADVAFTANADGGDTITGYTATCTSSDGGTTKTGSNGSSPVTVSSLSNGKTYACTVVATNGVGNSPASTASGDFVAATVPDAPTIDTADRGDNAAVVSFTPGVSDGGDTVTGYTATCASSDGGTTRTGTDTASPVTVHNLSNGKTYTCTVVATNAIGNSSASGASGAIVAAAVPDAPTIDTLTRDDNAAIVAFTPGADGGVSVDDFTVTCTSSDGGTTKTGNDTDSPITVSLLTNSKTYTCNVYATNSIGNGAASDDSDPFVAATVPNAPSVSGVTRGPNSAAVAFTSNGNGGDAITAVHRDV